MKKLIILLSLVVSCTVYKQPKPQIIHVLAITAEGDTLKLPLNVIRPIYNYNNINYPRTNYYPYNHMYYNYNNYKPIYKPSNGSNNSNNNNSGNNTTISRPSNATENLNLRKNK
jgi:hypothetical protein